MDLCAYFICSQFSANFQQLVHSIWTITLVFKWQMLKTWLDNYVNIYFWVSNLKTVQTEGGYTDKTFTWEQQFTESSIFMIMSVIELWGEQNRIVPEEQFSQSSSEL